MLIIGIVLTLLFYNKNSKKTQEENKKIYSQIKESNQEEINKKVEENLKTEKEEVKKDEIKESLILYKMGDNNQEIKDFQKKLFSIGYQITADGDFGSKTNTILKDFQNKKGIPQTGNYDANTKLYLFKEKDIRSYDID